MQAHDYVVNGIFLKDILAFLDGVELTLVARVSSLWHTYAGATRTTQGASKYVSRALSIMNMRALNARPELCTFDVLIDNIEYLCDAAREGRLDILQWAYNMHGIVHERTFAAIANYGHSHVHIAEWLNSINALDVDDIYISDIDMLKWVIQNVKAHAWCDIIHLAARYGRLDIIQWIYGEGYLNGHNNYVTTIIGTAAQHGKLDILEWTKEKGLQPNARWIYLFVCNHDGIRWLFDNIVSPNDEYKINCMVKVHDMDTLRALADTLNNTERDEMAGSAIEHGRVELLRYLIDVLGVAITANMPCSATYKGQLEILEFLRERGITPTAHDLMGASIDNRYHIIEWARSHGLHMDAQLYEFPIAHGNMEMIKYLVSIGIPTTGLMHSLHGAISSIELLEWLMLHGCKLDGSVVKPLIWGGNVKALKWAIEHGLTMPDNAEEVSDIMKLLRMNYKKCMYAVVKKYGLIGDAV